MDANHETPNAATFAEALRLVADLPVSIMCRSPSFREAIVDLLERFLDDPLMTDDAHKAAQDVLDRLCDAFTHSSECSDHWTPDDNDNDVWDRTVALLA